MEINDIVNAIEARVKLGRPHVKAQATTVGFDLDGSWLVSCVIDPSHLSNALKDDVLRFNEEANPEAIIRVVDAKLVNNSSDNTLFMIMFQIGSCN